MNLKRNLEPAGEQMTLFSLAGSRDHANRTVQQEKDLEKKMTDTSGQKCLEQFERFNRAGLWAKTFAGLLIGMEGWYSTKCRLTWKMKATRLRRFYFQLVASELHTAGTESGSLLSTPSANPMAEVEPDRAEKMGWKWSGTSWIRPDGSKVQTTLSHQIKMGLLPTPLASDAATGAILGKNDTFKMTSGLPRKVNQNGKDGSVGLGRLVQLLPTPAARDYRSMHAENSEAFQARQQNTWGVNLVEHLQRQMDGKTSQLNPQFVLEMMGFPPDWTLHPYLMENESQETHLLSESGEKNL